MPESHVEVRGYIKDRPGGSLSIITPEIVNVTAPNQISQLTLASGDSTIFVPTSAKGCVIIPDALSTTIKKLKGNAGDTGVIISKTLPTMLSFDSPPIGTFLINSSALDGALVTTVIFF